ncbi:reverse transcriptase domain-containing protein [Dickeya dianthicola]|nr:reverse transcriptase domain-containing protein [Dickeya dianthicola]MCI4116569.1 reverse transcriptase domain-containing protein [Dickeya dianthicola]MCI4120478.1 reverse transcriptase domain-containing protein [Dickeya dianthicola]MCI4123943.1 reverse transcriptase domain-containing protein [Dickeya dianthicola]
MEKWEHKFELKKDKWVHVPSKEMAKFGKSLHDLMRKKWIAPLYYYHMRDGGHVAAARRHIKSNFFALIDIKSFFESTSQSRVTRELKSFFPYNEAREIAKLSTVRIPSSTSPKFAIPYGYPQSPILATLCLHRSFAGSVLNSIAKKSNMVVSVYMDDIIISSDDLDVLSQNFEDLTRALKRSRYATNTVKTQQPSERIKVFNLELSNQSLKVSAPRIVEFLIAYVSSANEHERKGIASYVESVNRDQAKLFR